MKRINSLIHTPKVEIITQRPYFTAAVASSGYYYNPRPFQLQAATEPNPFFGTEASVAGDHHEIDRAGGGPPTRPPPPGGVSSSPAKTAFDDLNDSIRMAMGGGSPAKGPQQASAVAPQPMMQGGGYVGGAVMYSSPAKQPLGGGGL